MTRLRGREDGEVKEGERRENCVENLTPAGESVSRVPLNASDRDLAESLPLIRDILNRNDPSKAPPTGVAPTHPAPPSTPVQSASDGGSQPVSLFFCVLFLIDKKNLTHL
ncbi:unnamed protein product [Hydatigera taeniaeformis]|uniref:Uncharacterized protein n=1 Tax=Hydatigena taeniaeformis TaxID=6205 RepID=A0A0R3WQN1_HYDTA|nr:unnamed protein product [Hydatigera taeniaeformis]